MAAGYSGTGLAKKLGIKQGHIVGVVNEPDEFRALLVDLPDGVEFVSVNEPSAAGPLLDVVIAFDTRRDDLATRLDDLAAAVFPDRTVWLAWPKKSSGVETDLTGDVVRSLVLTTSLVDVKVGAISDVWSGLKVVWRREHR